MSPQRNMCDIWHDMNISKIIPFSCNKLGSKIICFRVGIEHTTEESQNAYLAATARTPKREEPIREEQPMATTPVAPSDTDSDSN